MLSGREQNLVKRGDSTQGSQGKYWRFPREVAANAVSQNTTWDGTLKLPEPGAWFPNSTEPFSIPHARSHELSLPSFYVKPPFSPKGNEPEVGNVQIKMGPVLLRVPIIA